MLSCGLLHQLGLRVEYLRLKSEACLLLELLPRFLLLLLNLPRFLQLQLKCLRSGDRRYLNLPLRDERSPRDGRVGLVVLVLEHRQKVQVIVVSEPDVILVTSVAPIQTVEVDREHPQIDVENRRVEEIQSLQSSDSLLRKRQLDVRVEKGVLELADDHRGSEVGALAADEGDIRRFFVDMRSGAYLFGPDTTLPRDAFARLVARSCGLLELQNNRLVQFDVCLHVALHEVDLLHAVVRGVGVGEVLVARVRVLGVAYHLVLIDC